MRRSF